MSKEKTFDEIQADMAAGLDKIRPIWNKWINIRLPRAIEDYITMAGETYSELVNQNINAGKIPYDERKLQEYGTRLAEGLATAFKGSYILGLEAGSKDKRAKRNDEYLSKQVYKAAEYLNYAGFPLSTWIYEQLVIGDASSGSESHHLGESLTKSIRMLQAECFRRGLMDSAK